MGFLDKLFGADEGDKPKEKSDDGKAERAAPPPPAEAARAAEPPVAGTPPAAAAPKAAGAPPAAAAAPKAAGASKAGPGERSTADIGDIFGPGIRLPRDFQLLLSAGIQAVEQHIDRTAAGFEQVQEGVQTLTGMLQAMAKSAARWDQERKQQFVELRAHLTTETDRLIGSMREQATRDASVDVFKAILPALDEVDHVLRENEAGAEVRAESIKILRRRLRDALSRLGIEETPIARRETAFDAELHEGRPYEGDPEAVAGLAPRVVVDVERNGWTGFGKVLRHALVTVVKE